MPALRHPLVRYGALAAASLDRGRRYAHGEPSAVAILDLGGSRSLIWINEPTKVFIARAGVHELTTTVLSEDQVRDLVEKMLKSSGRRVDLSAPFVDAMLPDGSRLHVVIPDITRRFWSVNIRKFVVRAAHLDDLVVLGSITAAAARFLDAAVRSGLNVLVSGGTQAGKTTNVIYPLWHGFRKASRPV